MYRAEVYNIRRNVVSSLLERLDNFELSDEEKAGGSIAMKQIVDTLEDYYIGVNDRRESIAAKEVEKE